MVVGFCKLCFAKKIKILDFKALFVNKIKKSNLKMDIRGGGKAKGQTVCSPLCRRNVECFGVIM